MRSRLSYQGVGPRVCRPWEACVRERLASLFASLLVLVVLSACTPAPPGASGSKLVYGLTLAPSGIDPHVDVSSELGIPLTSVYDTLVFRDPQGGFLPMLAQSWDISEDGTIYTFHLREGIRFHDGTPFDAAAVKATLDRIADPETKSRKAVLLLGPYRESRALDEHTIQVVLSEPFAPFLDSLSQVYLAPASPAALEQWGSEYQFHQVGTGPYMMKEYVPKDHLTLVRNPDYVGLPGIYGREGPAEVSEIEFRFLVEPAVRLLALEAGDADVVGEIPPQDAPRVEADADLNLVPVAIPGLPLVGFLNTRRVPTDEPAVRQALLLGSDRRSLVENVFGPYSPVAEGVLSHNHGDFAPESAEAYARYDPTEAARLLDEAGWVRDPSSEMRYRDGQPLRVEAYVMGWGLVPEVSQLLQAQWRDLGVDLVINEVTFTAALAAVGENEHNLIFWSEPGTDGDLLRSFFHSENVGLRNWSNFASPEMDALLERAGRESDPEARRELYGRVQAMIAEEALVLPVRDYVNLNGVRDRVNGLTFDSRGWFPLLHDVTIAPAGR